MTNPRLILEPEAGRKCLAREGAPSADAVAPRAAFGQGLWVAVPWTVWNFRMLALSAASGKPDNQTHVRRICRRFQDFVRNVGSRISLVLL